MKIREDEWKERGFNGAVTFSLRKFALFSVGLIYGFPLQWGRNFFVTEIWRAISERDALSDRFNGAVTFSLRKYEALHRFSPSDKASMGP